MMNYFFTSKKSYGIFKEFAVKLIYTYIMKDVVLYLAM